ncbi:DNA helicase [Maritalea porphyrae]|uniref:DNA helicase n=1 Tax=Maritalea porphyrae TaxID=880732 RepID=UPI0022AE6FEB|nr:DNA helicase [Maritalea porphyrae]MCZ4273973.1 DNA helicase [Maritalea porphyrae]
MKLSAPIHQLKRQAKLLARQDNIALHQALDRVAASEGFGGWSLLISKSNNICAAENFAKSLEPADMVLLGGRPGHGKTVTSLEIAFAKLAAGQDAYFFTLEYHARELNAQLVEMGFGELMSDAKLVVDTSDEICAEYIVRRMDGAKTGSVAVIDYLQILDQRRTTPTLDAQLRQLHSFARQNGVTLLLISQVDRSFEQSGKAFPELSDIRQPNPIDLDLFNKACFVHDKQMRWNKAA